MLRADPSTAYLVVEMGARGIGHIAYLCEIAPPSVAAVINVGTAHIGEFGSREAIAAAKGEIVEALPADGAAVLNADDALTSAMASRTEATVLTFGESGDVSWRGVELDDLGRPTFEIGYDGTWLPVTLTQTGRHQVDNAAAAAAMAVAVGVPFAATVATLGTAVPASRWRMEVHERADGLIVINDAYNANPASMLAALEALAAIGARRDRRTVAVLGEMRSSAPMPTRRTGRSGGPPRRPVSTWSWSWARRPAASPRASAPPSGAARGAHGGARRGAGVGARECRGRGRGPGQGVSWRRSRGRGRRAVGGGHRGTMRAILLGGGLALLISLLGTRVAIRRFTQLGYGQEIRDDGPTSHHTKRGTPTMGGVVIIAATLFGYFGAKLITMSAPSASACCCSSSSSAWGWSASSTTSSRSPSSEASVCAARPR